MDIKELRKYVIAADNGEQIQKFKEVLSKAGEPLTMPNSTELGFNRIWWGEFDRWCSGCSGIPRNRKEMTLSQVLTKIKESQDATS